MLYSFRKPGLFQLFDLQEYHRGTYTKDPSVNLSDRLLSLNHSGDILQPLIAALEGASK